ncbi:MAG: MBL fold metallo-hydrolase [Desulfovibrionaceae bacterium]
MDAGTGVRALSNLLMAEGHADFTFLFTHAHWDHIIGFPFFKPLYSPQSRILIRGCPLEQGNMETLLSRVMSPPFFPVPFESLRAEVRYEEHCDGPLVVDSMTIRTIPLSHPNLGVGFRFDEDDRRFVFLTDNELGLRHHGGRTFGEYVAFCQGADLLVHDAEYAPEEYPERRGWGHSTYAQALDLAEAAGVKRLGLYHHNQERSDKAVDELVARCRALVLERGLDVKCFAVAQGWADDV